MKILVSRHRPCTSLPLDDRCYYIGMKVAERTCHLFKSASGEVSVCSKDCVIRRLLEVTYVLKVTFDGRHVWVYTYDSFAARRIFERLGHPYHVVDARKVLLTKKEAEALRLFSKMRICAMAKIMGVSKAAASRLVKRAAAKASPHVLATPHDR
ncbi:MAG: hypothetical protein ACK4SY_08090 [Pyrobaculum sp.]